MILATGVLLLALDRPEVIVILDHTLARRHAEPLRIWLTGTLGVNLDAESRGLRQPVAPLTDEMQTRLRTGRRDSRCRLAQGRRTAAAQWIKN